MCARVGAHVATRDGKGERSNPVYSTWLPSKCGTHSRTIVSCQRDKQGKRCLEYLILSITAALEKGKNSLMNVNLTLFHGGTPQMEQFKMGC